MWPNAIWRHRSSISTKWSSGPSTPTPSTTTSRCTGTTGSHSLVVPRPEARYQQLTTFIFLFDVTEEDGPTRTVPYEDGKEVPDSPLSMPFGSLAEAEVACTGPAGSLLVSRTDILHRGSEITGSGQSRFSMVADFQVRGTTWGGKMAWPKQSPERWARFIPQCSVRERDLFGFPRPGDPYWDT